VSLGSAAPAADDGDDNDTDVDENNNNNTMQYISSGEAKYLYNARIF